VLNTIRHGTPTDTFVTEKAGKIVQVFIMQQDYMKRTKYQKLRAKHENSMKKYVKKAGKTLVHPCASLQQDMNWATTNREENVNTYRKYIKFIINILNGDNGHAMHAVCDSFVITSASLFKSTIK
jgi:predicted ATPase